MGSRENTLLIGLLVILTVAPAHDTAAGPLGLPDATRPGAVRPEEQPEGRAGPPASAAEMPGEVPGEVLEVPAVIDRPFEVNEGPTMIVRQFRLLDARDLPEFGIKLSEVQALLAQEKQKYPDGFTIGQLQEAADAVTRYYREKGLILAQAVLPVQTISGGLVDLQIYEGRLGNVLTEGNVDYSDLMLRAPLKGLLGKPVTKDTIETVLLYLTDFPGLSVFGVFVPGKQVGTADIVLRVQDEDRLDVAFRADNHGLQETGRMRWRTTIDWNNPTGGADKFSTTIQQTYNPKNNVFLSFDYQRYLAPGWTAGGFWQKNRFTVGGEFADLNITGETKLIGLWLDKAWRRSRQFNLSTRLGLTKKDSDSLARGSQTNRDRLAVASLEFNMDHVDTRFKGINFGTLEFSRGFNDLFGAMGSSASATALPVGVRPSRQAGDGRFASGQFSKVFLSASRLQTLWKNASLLGRLEYQWTDDFLLSSEQYSVGGPDNVRAYSQAQFLLDRAAFLSLEYIQNMPFITDVPAFGNRTWGELVQLSLFYDHAVGRLERPLPTQQQGYINFRGAGIQARFTLPGVLESRLMWAWELSGHDDPESPKTPANGRKPQFWGELIYRF